MTIVGMKGVRKAGRRAKNALENVLGGKSEKLGNQCKKTHHRPTGSASRRPRQKKNASIQSKTADQHLKEKVKANVFLNDQSSMLESSDRRARPRSDMDGKSEKPDKQCIVRQKRHRSVQNTSSRDYPTGSGASQHAQPARSSSEKKSDGPMLAVNMPSPLKGKNQQLGVASGAHFFETKVKPIANVRSDELNSPLESRHSSSSQNESHVQTQRVYRDMRTQLSGYLQQSPTEQAWEVKSENMTTHNTTSETKMTSPYFVRGLNFGRGAPNKLVTDFHEDEIAHERGVFARGHAHDVYRNAKLSNHLRQSPVGRMEETKVNFKEVVKNDPTSESDMAALNLRCRLNFEREMSNSESSFGVPSKSSKPSMASPYLLCGLNFDTETITSESRDRLATAEYRVNEDKIAVGNRDGSALSRKSSNLQNYNESHVPTLQVYRNGIQSPMHLPEEHGARSVAIPPKERKFKASSPPSNSSMSSLHLTPSMSPRSSYLNSSMTPLHLPPPMSPRSSELICGQDFDRDSISSMSLENVGTDGNYQPITALHEWTSTGDRTMDRTKRLRQYQSQSAFEM